MQATYAALEQNAGLLPGRRWPAGWARVRLKMTASRPERLKLYADEDDGLESAASLLNLEVAGAVDFDGFIHVDRPFHSLRFDPPLESGEFQLESLRIEPLSRLQALGHALVCKVKLLRKYCRTRQAIGRALALLARGDFARIKHKLYRGLNGPDFEGREPYDEAAGLRSLASLSRALTDQGRGALRAEAAALADPPVVSILLTLGGQFKAEVRRSIDSVVRQTYPYWELCIACDSAVEAAIAGFVRNDPRVRFTGASANGGLAAATGSFVMLLDEGDELAEHALSKFCQAVITDPLLDMLYADEDRLSTDGRHAAPFFKPDWSPESLLAWMYTGRPGVYRTSVVRDIGGFRAEFGPAYEYDLVLRMAARSRRAGRVADVLYHRAKALDSREAFDEAGRRALRNHLDETKRRGAVEVGPAPGLHRVHFTPCGSPLISIIIPSACRRVHIRGDRAYYLLKCLESIQKSTWRRYETIVMHGDRIPARVASCLEECRSVRAAYDSPFNWSRAMNQGAALARGQHLLFLNDDVEVITPDWLERLLEFSQQSAIGAVGAKLFFPGGAIQHAGVAVLEGRPQHSFYGYNGEHSGYFGNLLVPRNCSAVTGACLMTRADVFRSAGGFDEELPLNYNDVDYCLRMITSGKRIVCTPYARLYHHELGTRPAEVRPEESEAMRQRWGKLWTNDPYYNPNLLSNPVDYRIQGAERESACQHGRD